MDRARSLLTVLIVTLGAAGLFALTVYPFQYGFVESAVLLGIFVAVGLFELVLEQSTLGA